VDTRGVRDATGQPDGLAGYAIERAIGRGHFSTVHKAIHALSGRPVAIKRIQIFDSMDAKSRDRCLKEVELLQSLDAHPSIIEYIDAFLDSNELYIVFEWAAHGDLRRLMRKAQEANVLFDESHIWHARRARRIHQPGACGCAPRSRARARPHLARTARAARPPQALLCADRGRGATHARAPRDAPRHQAGQHLPLRRRRRQARRPRARPRVLRADV
jgi:hypothetical protein